ncbi:MAG: hypothetical protein GY754_24820 [bacterium]|nr:hypothetical protein [bacterium]
MTTLDDHVPALKKLLVESSDLLEIFNYFLDHFVDDETLVKKSKKFQDPLFKNIVDGTIGHILKGKKSNITAYKMLQYKSTGFYHGVLMAGMNFFTCFYFSDIDKGLIGYPDERMHTNIVRISTAVVDAHKAIISNPSTTQN